MEDKKEVFRLRTTANHHDSQVYMYENIFVGILHTFIWQPLSHSLSRLLLAL